MLLPCVDFRLEASGESALKNAPYLSLMDYKACHRLAPSVQELCDDFLEDDRSLWRDDFLLVDDEDFPSDSQTAEEGIVSKLAYNKCACTHWCLYLYVWVSVSTSVCCVRVCALMFLFVYVRIVVRFCACLCVLFGFLWWLWVGVKGGRTFFPGATPFLLSRTGPMAASLLHQRYKKPTIWRYYGHSQKLGSRGTFLWCVRDDDFLSLFSPFSSITKEGARAPTALHQ